MNDGTDDQLLNAEEIPSDISFANQTPAQSAQNVIDEITSTPEGLAEVDRIGGKDVQLTQFQNSYNISDRIAEAAIKEWVMTHDGNWDYNLREVMAICLRNSRSGIPFEYLPESEKGP